MKLPFSNKTKKEHSVTKLFSYSKNGVSLSFNLRLDKKSEMKAFEELLVEALAEVQEEIEK